MKRFIKTAIWIIAALILFFACQTAVFALEDSDTENEIRSQIDTIMEEYDISFTYDDADDLSFTGIISAMGDNVSARINAPVKLLGIILTIIVFTSFAGSIGETAISNVPASNLYNLVCTLAAVTVITPTLLDVYSNAAYSLELGAGFMLVFVPVFAGISILSGEITSAGIYNAVSLGIAELMIQAASGIIMPILTMSAALSVCGSIFENVSLDKIVQLMRKLITWGMTVSVSLFTGFLSLKCTLGSTADGFTSKTVKFMVSGFVPVIGSAISDAYTTVRGSLEVMRCTAGMAGTIAAVLIMLPPLIEVLAFRMVMWIANAIAGMFSLSSLEKLFKSLDAGLAIAFSILVCFTVFFIISTGILMKSMS